MTCWPTRRRFLVGAGAAIAAAASSRIASLSFADDAGAVPHFGILITIFLRGGMDGLNLVAPVDDPHYIAARPPALRIIGEGDGAGLPLGNAPAGFDFRLHPNAKPLKDIYDAGQLAIIHAAGLTSGTRSHFEAMDLMERGITEGQDQNISTGWLARHLSLAADRGLLPAITTSDTPPGSLLGATSAIAVPDLSGFAFAGDDNQFAAVRSLYEGEGPLRVAGARTMAGLKLLKEKLPHNEKGEIQPYQPADGVSYPGQSDLTKPLQVVAQLIKIDVGLTAAAVDFGGWDTHQAQAGHFAGLVDQLSNALAAFHNDVANFRQRVTVVVMSEFGRRLKSNQSGGTDHGHGNVMLAMGGSVNGGKIHGKWPGLANEQLDSGADLAITTDYRTVLAEVLNRRFGDTRLGEIFPGLKRYAPLGIFKGADIATDLQ